MIFIIYSNLNRKTIINVKNCIYVNFISYNLNNKTIIDVKNGISVKDKDQRTFLYCCSCFNELWCFAMRRIATPEYSITPTSHQEREREIFYLTTHSTHFIYGYMASDIWLWTILIVREETRCRYIGYSLRLTARVLLYAPSHRQDSTYHGLCYTSRGALAGTRTSHQEDCHSHYRFDKLVLD